MPSVVAASKSRGRGSSSLRGSRSVGSARTRTRHSPTHTPSDVTVDNDEEDKNPFESNPDYDEEDEKQDIVEVKKEEPRK